MRILLLMLAFALAVWTIGSGAPQPENRRPAQTGMSDQWLYRAVAVQQNGCSGYYQAAIAMQRQWHYPVSPFVTVRLPLLACALATVGERGMRIGAMVLVVAAAMLWTWRLSASSLGRRAAVCGALAGVGLPLALSPFVFLHDFWAGILLTFALAFRHAAWRVGWGLAAALVRELVAPFLVLQAAAYALTRRMPAMALAGCAIVVFGAVIVLHREQVMALTRSTDLVSQGWHGMRGPAAMVQDVAGLTVLQFLPWPAVSALAILPLLGWFDARDGRLGFAWFALFLAVIAIFSRPDNAYWAANILPIYFAGYAFLPDYLRNLAADWRQLRSWARSRTQPTR